MKVLPVAISLLTALAAASPVNRLAPRDYRSSGLYYTSTQFNEGDVYGMTYADENSDFCFLTEGAVARMDVFENFWCTLYMNGTATVGGCNGPSKTYKHGWNITVDADFVHAAAYMCSPNGRVRSESY